LVAPNIYVYVKLNFISLNCAHYCRTFNLKIETKFKLWLHGKNDFAERSKILRDTDSKIFLLDQQNNFVGISKIMSNIANNFN